MVVYRSVYGLSTVTLNMPELGTMGLGVYGLSIVTLNMPELGTMGLGVYVK